MTPLRTAAIVGSGPAGLMAAFVLASSKVEVTVFEKRKSAGRKLLIAGSSGLNISYDCPENELHENYRGAASSFQTIFKTYGREKWIGFVESLGLETFKGTSRRYFVREMKAAGLLRAWMDRLKSMGVHFEFGQEVTGFQSQPPTLQLSDSSLSDSSKTKSFDAVGFFLGGGSWEPTENPLRWPGLFLEKNLRFEPFKSSNAGFEIDWPAAFLKEAEGQPLKSISLTTPLGSRKGELMVTSYGLEGTPIYAIGKSGTAHLDLKPDLTAKEITSKLNPENGENLSAMRRIKKYLKLCEASEALLFHLSRPEERADLAKMTAAIKRFPIQLKGPRPLAEAISSSGGLSWDELNGNFMLKKYPGFFAAGEMLDWDAPTGGFLIQGCVSQGYFAGIKMLEYTRNGADFHKK